MATLNFKPAAGEAAAEVEEEPFSLLLGEEDSLGLNSVEDFLGPPPSSLTSMEQRLGRAFFDVPCTQLARALLGKILVRKIAYPNGRCLALRGLIVETESYLGVEDKASHSFKGKKTPKNEAMFMQPGTAYVYSIHTHLCFNVTSGGGADADTASAVLIRAVQPLTGLCQMSRHRASKPGSSKKPLTLRNLCNGPGKLCSALQISKDFNKLDLTGSDQFYLIDCKKYANLSTTPADSSTAADLISVSPRIGIGPSAEEWRLAPLRFFIRGNRYVSKNSGFVNPRSRKNTSA